MINVLVIVMEGIAAWLCLHCAFGEKISKTGRNIAFFVIYLALYWLCCCLSVEKIFGLSVFVWLFVWGKIQFNRIAKELMLKTIICIIILGLIEIASMFIYSIFLDYVYDVQIKYFIGTLISLVLSFAIYNVFVRQKLIRKKLFWDNLIEVCIGLFFLFIIVLKIEFELNKRISLVFVLYFVILAIAFVILYNKQKIIYSLETKKLTYEMHNIYGRAYNDLLNEIRRKQHDYKNQLYAITSINMTAQSLTELKEKQSNYILLIEKDNELDYLLTNCNNSILAGYLYSVLSKYKQEGFNVKVNISVKSDEINSQTKDIIEIFGILLNNAYEYLNEFNINKKVIKVGLLEKSSGFEISVSNISDKLSNSSIEEMFVLGKSTKGNGRGLGLSSLKTIVKKYSGEIWTSCEEKHDEYWLQFIVKI